MDNLLPPERPTQLPLRLPLQDVYNITGIGIAYDQIIPKSIKLIMQSGCDYEFRTTFMHPLHTIDDCLEIGKCVAGAAVHYVQQYVPVTKQLNPMLKLQPFSYEQAQQCVTILQRFVARAAIRGY